VCPFDEVLWYATHVCEALEHDLVVEYAVVEPVTHTLGDDQDHHQERQGGGVACKASTHSQHYRNHHDPKMGNQYGAS
jgi:hypothetical protein